MSETVAPHDMKDAKACMICDAAALCMQMHIQGMRQLWASFETGKGRMAQELNVLCSL